MQEKSLAELLEDNFQTLSARLPVLHPIALELERLKADGRASMDQIVAIIEKDPTLAGQILRLANSAFYRGLTPVDTLSRAVVRLGIKKAASLAFAASMTLACRVERQPFKDKLRQTSRRALLGANAARWLLEQTGQQDRAEEAFLAVLFHDLGEIFVLRGLEQLIEPTEELSEALIDEATEQLHPGFGARLLTYWNLPQIYVDIAQGHHRETFEANDWRMALVRLVDLACRKLGIGQAADEGIALAATAEAEALDLQEITLAQFEIHLEDAASAEAE